MIDALLIVALLIALAMLILADLDDLIERLEREDRTPGTVMPEDPAPARETGR